MYVSGFSEDAQKAIRDNPSYFAAWYTAKSIGLCAAIATITYLVGRENGRKQRRRRVRRGRRDS